MKAMIVDDEKHVREGLMLLADWDTFGIQTVLEAENGEEATELILTHQPDIIFTDMRMPKRDGVSLLKWISEQNLEAKTIVVSGYDDFEYMRNAIYYKSFDYLLKPIDPDLLNETLNRAISDLNQLKKKRKSSIEDNKVMNEVKQLYIDQLFSSVIRSAHEASEAWRKLEKQLEVDLTKTTFTVATIQVRPIINRFQGDADLCFFSLNNMCHELIRLNGVGVSFRNVNEEAELVIVCWNNQPIRSLLEKLHSSIYQLTHVRTPIALGEEKRTIKEAYQSSRLVGQTYSLLNPKPIVSISDRMKRPILHLLDHSKELQWALKSGNKEQMTEVLNRIFHTMETNHSLTYEQIEEWEKAFSILQKSWMTEYEMERDHEIYEGKDYWNADGTFSFSTFKREKEKEFYRLIETLTERKYQTEETNMQQIAAYLREHYAEDIQLQAIADRFYLSREYISRKFKQEFHETITDYVTTIRIEKAKELLANAHFKIYEIAFQVGYQNEKYFSKVFKKLVGMTPNEYRNYLQERKDYNGKSNRVERKPS